MSESEYISKEAEEHPEPAYLADLRILRRFVQNGSFGYRESKDVVFQTLKNRYPEAYAAFGRERKGEVLEAYKTFAYIEGQRKAYPVIRPPQSGQTSVELVFGDDPDRMDDAGDEAEDRQQDVYPEVLSYPDLQEHPQGREQYRDYDTEHVH